MPRRLATTSAGLGLALLLAGCADMGNIHPQSHTLPANALKAGSAIHAAKPAAWPTEAWWEALGDAQLNRLVQAGPPTLTRLLRIPRVTVPHLADVARLV